ncbi:hypothetical protein B0O95_1182 [Mycetohabitans endofungorum]|uniref:Uncharacterized protein n=1 Tax=Mycetohabitans endofungorum TaxID=417203 RepID=A0A2P5K7G3_9BURK|nr:hypothetical protein B0O95_1182 [Mycetohabitans endofungorum]
MRTCYGGRLKVQALSPTSAWRSCVACEDHPGSAWVIRSLAAFVWSAGCWEPYELRGSRTILGARGGRFPRARLALRCTVKNASSGVSVLPSPNQRWASGLAFAACDCSRWLRRFAKSFYNTAYCTPMRRLRKCSFQVKERRNAHTYGHTPRRSSLTGVLSSMNSPIVARANMLASSSVIGAASWYVTTTAATKPGNSSPRRARYEA